MLGINLSKKCRLYYYLTKLHIDAIQKLCQHNVAPDDRVIVYIWALWNSLWNVLAISSMTVLIIGSIFECPREKNIHLLGTTATKRNVLSVTLSSFTRGRGTSTK